GQRRLRELERALGEVLRRGDGHRHTSDRRLRSGLVSLGTPELARSEQLRPGRPRTVRSTLTAGSALGLGVAMLWFSLLVLIPLVAVFVTASAGGWPAFWAAITTPQTAHAIWLTVSAAFAITALNVVMGTAIAWVLVRDRFPGRGVLEIVIDIPFALPTIV